MKLDNPFPTKKSLSPSKRLPFFLSAFSVTLITFLVYLPALQNGFVNWDDPTYVYRNTHIRTLDLHFIKWAFSSEYFSNWHPLTMISLALDYAMWGLNPLGYHLTNIILHAINTFLVFVLVSRLIECGVNPTLTLTLTLREREESSLPFKGRVGEGMGLTQNFQLLAAFVTALLFGIHPLHVESVAWISERKDVLYAFFFLLSLIAYTRYISAKGHKPYLLSLAFFILALLSKPMAISLPVVLLILDYYPFNRLTLKGVWLEKMPFFLLGLISSLVTIWAQQSEGAIPSAESFPLWVRLFVAVHGYVFYLLKIVLPLNLAPFYPYPGPSDLFTLEYMGAIVPFTAILFMAIRFINKNRSFSAAAFYYSVTLLPVIGLVQVGDHSAADRYTYLPSLGPFILIGIGSGIMFERARNRLPIIIALMALLGVLGIKTMKQTNIWQDSISLWSHEIKLFPDRPSRGYVNRGTAWFDMGKYREAISDYRRAVEVNPGDIESYNSRGNAYEKLGHYKEAIGDYKKVIQIDPNCAEAYNNLGVVYNDTGKYIEAISNYSIAIKLKPGYSGAYANRGNAYKKLGHYEEAIGDYKRAIEIDPNCAEVYNNLGIVYYDTGKYNEAINNYSIAIKLKPGYSDAYANLGLVYRLSGNDREAAANIKKAAELGSKQAQMYLDKEGIAWR